VVAYCRYSTELQNPRSIADQLRLCQQYAARQGWPPIPPDGVFSDEHLSGDISQRPAYQRLLASIENGNGHRPGVILTEGFERLARDKVERAWLERMAPIWDVAIISVSDDQEITDDGAEYKAIEDQRYLRNLRKKIRRGLAGRFDDGLHPGGTIYGYASVPVPHASGRLDRWGRPLLAGHKLEIHPDQASVVRRIYAEAAVGLSPRDIAAGLQRDGVPKPCAAYNFKTPQSAARAARPWNPGTVLGILRNDRYRGVWRYQKTLCVGRLPDTEKKVMRATDETLTQTREALQLIADPTWNRVQDILDARAEGVRRDEKTGRLAGREKGCAPNQVFGKAVSNPLHGLLKCAVCRGPVVVSMSKELKDGSRVRYLACMRGHHFKDHCTNAGACRLDRLEAGLQRVLWGYFSDTKLMQAHVKRFYVALAEHRRQQTADEARAKADLAAAEKAIANVKAAILKGMVGDTTAEMLKKAEATKAAATQALQAAQEAHTAEPRLVPPAEVVRGLNAQHQRERRQAYQRLLSEVRLRAVRPEGRRMVTGWTVEIVPRPEAGITGLPKSVALGKDVFTVGRAASGRDGPPGDAAG
jgi:DNA invertase Pin-like site-specific DNA recombinase